MADKITRVCPNCHEEFIVFHQQSRFCCDDCRKRYHAKMRARHLEWLANQKKGEKKT